MDASKIKIPGYEEAINIKDEKARNKLSNIVYVNDFGAVADGNTDCSDAIQNAINSTENGAISFFPGVYAITKPINVKDRAIIINLNGAKIIAKNRMNAMFNFANIEYAKSGTQPIISNGCLDGNNQAEVCIALYRYQGLIDRMTLCNFANSAISEQHDSNSPQKVITNCYILGGVAVEDGWSEVDRTGIILGGDCIIDNVNIGRCKTGMHLSGQYNQLGNVHIWTQTSNTRFDTLEQFNTFIGIKVDLGCDVSINNYYADRLKFCFWTPKPMTDLSNGVSITCSSLQIVIGDDIIKNQTPTTAFVMACRANYDIKLTAAYLPAYITLQKNYANTTLYAYTKQNLEFIGYEYGAPQFKPFDIHDLRKEYGMLQYNVNENQAYKIAQFRSVYESFAVIHLELYQGDYLFYEGDFKLTFGQNITDATVVNLNIPSPNNDYQIMIAPDTNVTYSEYDGEMVESVMSLYVKSTRNSQFVVRWQLKVGNVDVYFTKQPIASNMPANALNTKTTRGVAADGSGLSLYWYIYNNCIVGYFAGDTTEHNLRTFNIPIHPRTAWRTFACYNSNNTCRVDFNTNGNVEVDLSAVSGSDSINVTGNFMIPLYEWGDSN